jgi:hypothetical protein
MGFDITDSHPQISYLNSDVEDSLKLLLDSKSSVSVVVGAQFHANPISEFRLSRMVDRYFPSRSGSCPNIRSRRRGSLDRTSFSAVLLYITETTNIPCYPSVPADFDFPSVDSGLVDLASVDFDFGSSISGDITSQIFLGVGCRRRTPILFQWLGLFSTLPPFRLSRPSSAYIYSQLIIWLTATTGPTSNQLVDGLEGPNNNGCVGLRVYMKML